MLKATALCYEQDDQKLFSDLTFLVDPGTLLLVSGVNGAGKSSLLKILAGLWEPSSGTVAWRGHGIKPGDPLFLSELLYIGHKIGIQPILTPFENLKWLLEIRSDNSNNAKKPDKLKSDFNTVAKIQSALEIVGLKGLESVPCERLSKGQQQRVALARLWVEASSCWILDEPFTGLDDAGRKLLIDRFVEHLKQSGCLVLASHHLLELEVFKPIKFKTKVKIIEIALHSYSKRREAEKWEC